MKIVVTRKRGGTETLTLVPPVSIRLGQHFNVLTDASGMDHFFYPDTGLYDGWGLGLPPGQEVTFEQAQDIIESVEISREPGPEGTSE